MPQRLFDSSLIAYVHGEPQDPREAGQDNDDAKDADADLPSHPGGSLISLDLVRLIRDVELLLFSAYVSAAQDLLIVQNSQFGFFRFCLGSKLGNLSLLRLFLRSVFFGSQSLNDLFQHACLNALSGPLVFQLVDQSLCEGAVHDVMLAAPTHRTLRDPCNAIIADQLATPFALEGVQADE